MKWKPCKRGDFIKKLRAIGFEGAYSGAKHQFMVFNNAASQFLQIPNTPFRSCG
jgi:hypothetical protein